jgi:hypothetical protein
MAIFKVHTLFLNRHSEVLRDMFTVAQSEEADEKEDNKPLVLHDKVRGWEVLLSSFYREYVALNGIISANLFLREPFLSFEFTGQDMLSVLEITNKYGMHELQKRILERLKKADTTQEFVDMISAAQMIQDPHLLQKGIEGLRHVSPRPNWEQVQAIGLRAYYELNS